MLSYIALSTICASLLGMLLASWISVKVLAKVIRQMVNFSIGALLGIALLHSLPEAFEMAGGESKPLFVIFLGGLLAFFLLEKFSLLRHSHHHEGDGHDHAHGFDKNHAGRNGMVVVMGDGLHNFIDGVLIASAYLTDVYLGLITTFAVISHEVPQKIGNFIVLLNAGVSRSRAYAWVGLSGLMACIGGLVGYLFLQIATEALPYLLTVSAAIFVYVAVSDLMPQTQDPRHSLREVVVQVALVGLGLAVIAASLLIHPHEPDGHEGEAGHAALSLSSPREGAGARAAPALRMA